MKNAAKVRSAPLPAADFIRRPGLFRRWEFEQVIQIGCEFVVDDAGTAADGTQLYALYEREPAGSH
jgi:hypothetical protein